MAEDTPIAVLRQWADLFLGMVKPGSAERRVYEEHEGVVLMQDIAAALSLGDLSGTVTFQIACLEAAALFLELELSEPERDDVPLKTRDQKPPISPGTPGTQYPALPSDDPATPSPVITQKCFVRNDAMVKPEETFHVPLTETRSEDVQCSSPKPTVIEFPASVQPDNVEVDDSRDTFQAIVDPRQTQDADGTQPESRPKSPTTQATTDITATSSEPMKGDVSYDSPQDVHEPKTMPLEPFSQTDRRTRGGGPDTGTRNEPPDLDNLPPHTRAIVEHIQRQHGTARVQWVRQIYVGGSVAHHTPTVDGVVEDTVIMADGTTVDGDTFQRQQEEERRRARQGDLETPVSGSDPSMSGSTSAEH